MDIRRQRPEFGVSQLGRDAKAVLNKPVQLAGVFDGKSVKLFIDGKLQQQTSAVTGPITPSQLPVSVGAGFDSSGTGVGVLDGRVYAVRISKGALYTKDFQPLPRYHKTKSTLVLLHVSEGNGRVVHDASGHGYDAAVVGAKWVRRPVKPVPRNPKKPKSATASTKN